MEKEITSLDILEKINKKVERKEEKENIKKPKIEKTNLDIIEELEKNRQMDIHVIFVNALMLIAVLNPFGNVPLFIGMTDGMEKDIRKKLFKAIAITGFFITWIFSLIGEFLMTNFYKINMNELRMAGGLILILMAIKNLSLIHI